MVLQSQSRRPLARTSHMYRRGRDKRIWPAVIAVAVLATAGFVLLKLWPGQTTDEESADLGQVAGGQEIPEGSGVVRGTSAVVRIESLDIAGKEKVQIEPPTLTQTESSSKRTRTPIQLALGTDEGDSRGSPDKSPTPPLAKFNPPSNPDRARAQGRVESGLDLLARNQPLEARRSLSRALLSGSLDEFESDRTREKLRILNQRLVFSPEIIENDPFARSYVVQPNEMLSKIVRDQGLAVDWRFILRINGIREARHVRAGQRLKLISGPFHAVIDKSEFRMDLYMGGAPDLVYVASYPVGLGEFNSTPTGVFEVRTNSKLINPEWRNPYTRELFASNDPQNPIGERWIGLQGIEEHNRDFSGYGIHGTIEPESIGRQSSMGCIRMRPEDVEIVYELLVERASTIEIQP